MSNATQKSNGLLLLFSADMDVVLFKMHLGELLVRLRTVKVASEKDKAILNEIGQALGLVSVAANATAPALKHTLHWARRNRTVYRVSDDDGRMYRLFSLDLEGVADANGDCERADLLLDSYNRVLRQLDATPDRKTQALEAILAELRLIGPALQGIARGVNKS